MKKLVFAFYYIWYGNPKVSKKWLKWDNAGHNPDNKLNGLNDISAAHHPTKEPYDSSDEKIIRRQLQQAKKAGIDSLLTSVWLKTRGLEYTQKVFDKILTIADTTNMKLTFYFEDLPSYEPSEVADAIIKMLKRYGKHKSFYTVNGKPIILLYSRVLLQLGLDKWITVAKLVNEKIKTLFIADTKDEKWVKNFDGAFRYTILDDLLSKRDQEKVYQEYVNKCKKHDKISCLTVMPGYDDSALKNQKKEFFSDLGESVKKELNIMRMLKLIWKLLVRIKNGEFRWILLTFGIHKYEIASREKGKVYERLWKAAIKADPEIVLITSFNEWHEGTEIEPSEELEDKYLQMTEKFIKEFKK